MPTTCRSPAVRAIHETTEREGRTRAWPRAVSCSGRLGSLLLQETLEIEALFVHVLLNCDQPGGENPGLGLLWLLRTSLYRSGRCGLPLG